MLEHREKRQWTRQRLAVESRVSVSHIRVIEVRRGNPSVLVFVSIALALGVDADKLLREAMQRKAYLDDLHRAGEHNGPKALSQEQAVFVAVWIP